MAHFAKIDENGIVIDVQSVANQTIQDSEGVEQESLGVAFLNKVHKTDDVWVQTSYNHNFRKQYAGIGMIYDPVKDKFLSQQPYASWSLDSSDDWQAPITYPSTTSGSGFTYFIKWNETKYNADNDTGWEATKSNDDAETKTVYNWNGSAWVSE